MGYMMNALTVNVNGSAPFFQTQVYLKIFSARRSPLEFHVSNEDDAGEQDAR